MRALVGWVLALGLIASPALAAGNGEADSKGAATSDSATSTAKDSSGSAPSAAAKADALSLESEIGDLRDLIDSQAKQLESQNDQLQQEQKKLEMLEEQLKASSTARENAAASPAPTASLTANASASGVIEGVAAAKPTVLAAVVPQGGGNAAPESPLQFKIGSAFIAPVGFMDFTGEYRSRDGGSGIGTNFASIPYGNPNLIGGTQPFQNNLGEFRFSMQNSRIGFRVDAMVKGAHVIGYMESDFLGNNPGNVAVSSNSNTLRSRVYWVDVAKDKWEVLGGQTWSLITPGRVGISPIPGNIFNTQDIDVNYQAGLVWGRIPEFRFVYRPSSKAAIALALDSPEQYAGGSAGGGTVVYPTSNNVGSTTVGYPAQLNTGGSTLGAPNIAPDIIVKLALDPLARFHAEAGGLERQFRVYDPVNATKFSATGAGAFVNLGFDVFKGFRVLTNNFWSDGGGRYIFGQAPDLIAHTDGNISLIHSNSTVSGFEYTHKNTLLYAYYGGIYIQKNATIDTGNGNAPIGYGFPGSPSGQNRAIQEETVGFNQAFWRSPTYGALNFMGQYSYLSRNPWAVSNPTSAVPFGSPKDAHLNMIFINLRYTLPGAAPAAAQLK